MIGRNLDIIIIIIIILGELYIEIIATDQTMYVYRSINTIILLYYIMWESKEKNQRLKMKPMIILYMDIFIFIQKF